MKQTIRKPVFAVVLLALAASGPLSAAAADEQMPTTQAADSSTPQQSQDDALIQAIDIWQLVDQDSPQETQPSADAPAQELPAEEKTTPQAEPAAAAPADALSSGQQNNAAPAQEAVIIEAQAPVEEQLPEKPAASVPSQPQSVSPAAVPNRQQDSAVPAQGAGQPSTWSAYPPDQEIVVIEAQAPVKEQLPEKPAASVPSQPQSVSPAAVPNRQQNSGSSPAQSQNRAQPQFRQDSGWPVPEPPQSLPTSSAPQAVLPAMTSASAGQQAVQQSGSPAFPAPVLAPPAAQDDIVAAVEEAMRQYRSKDFAGAVSNLDYAAHLIRQKKTELLKKLLPEPFYGWQAKEAVSQSLGTAVFGGGSTVSRDYFTQNGSVISIEIVSDSPVLQSIIMMLNNPLFAGASGGNLKTIKRQRAMIKYNEEEHSGEINIVVASRFIVTVKGRGIDMTWLLRYAEAMDFDVLAKN